MQKITYFDVEYANSKNKSICQIGLMCEDFTNGEPIYPELDVYVNPEDGFDNQCIKIHGISNKTVENEPAFNAVWPKIENYFVNAVVVGHNVASADLDALVKALIRYNIAIPEIYYICTYELAKQYIPSFCVPNYKMSTLCEYFDIDIDSEHNAFDDACACSDLFKTLVNEYDINVDSHVRKYELHETKAYEAYVSNPVLRKSISGFYGLIRGFSIDDIINNSEIECIKLWRNQNVQYSNHSEIANIISVIDQILEDGCITAEEISILQGTVKNYLDIVSTSPITLASQILDGILRGITADGKITEGECINLRQWLYDNIYLSDHYPFDKAIKMVDSVLEDGIITEEELSNMTSIISEILNPVDSLKSQVYSVEGKHVCLSGNFSYGEKSKVESYIIERGGEIDSNVKKATNILIIGDEECQSFSNGTYGRKVKKAIEYNENKGCSIQIIRESDFFSCVN